MSVTVLENDPIVRIKALEAAVQRLQAAAAGDATTWELGDYKYTSRVPSTLIGLVLIDEVWAVANGASLSKATFSGYDAVLSALSYPFGSTGTTFALADMTGRRDPVSAAAGYALGLTSGALTHTLTASNLPASSPYAFASNGPYVKTLATTTVNDPGTGGTLKTVVTGAATTGDPTLGTNGGGGSALDTQDPYIVAGVWVVKVL